MLRANIKRADRLPVSTKFLDVAYEVGGHHIAAIARTEFQLSEIVSRPVDNSAERDTLLRSFEQIGRDVMSQLVPSPQNVRRVSFAVPGPFNYEKGISQMRHKFPALYGVNLKVECSKWLCKVPSRVIFINDAEAFLLGELLRVPAHRAIGITLGTGIGAAFAVDGRIVRLTSDGVPSADGLYRLPWGDVTVEDVISTVGIMKKHRDLGGECTSVRGIAMGVTDKQSCRGTMNWLGKELGKVIVRYCSAFCPDSIFLGGAIAKSDETFLPSLKAEVGHLGERVMVNYDTSHTALLGALGI